MRACWFKNQGVFPSFIFCLLPGPLLSVPLALQPFFLLKQPDPCLRESFSKNLNMWNGVTLNTAWRCAILSSSSLHHMNPKNTTTEHLVFYDHTFETEESWVIYQTYYVPNTFLSTWQTLTDLIFKIALIPLFLFCRWANWGTEKLIKLFKNTQLLNGSLGSLVPELLLLPRALQSFPISNSTYIQLFCARRSFTYVTIPDALKLTSEVRVLSPVYRCRKWGIKKFRSIPMRGKVLNLHSLISESMPLTTCFRGSHKNENMFVFKELWCFSFSFMWGSHWLTLSSEYLYSEEHTS